MAPSPCGRRIGASRAHRAGPDGTPVTRKADGRGYRSGRRVRPRLDRRPSIAGPAEVLDLALGLLLGVAVALLDLADELVPVAGDLGQLVIRQLAPFRLDLALDLLPVALDLVPV